MARAASSPDRRPVTTATTLELSPDYLAALKAYRDVFMMYEFKVRLCPLTCAHEWTSCPLAHPGEVARRRDPGRVAYSAEACPDFRRGPAGGACPRGSGCPFAHGTFEQWLHPSRYRTRPCHAGVRCARRVCFFAHTDKEIRLTDDAAVARSPRSTLTAWQESPPLSPIEGGNMDMDMKRLTAWQQSPPLSPIEGGNVNMDMERLIALQQINTREEMQDAVLFPTTSEDIEPDFRWVHDLLM